MTRDGEAEGRGARCSAERARTTRGVRGEEGVGERPRSSPYTLRLCRSRRRGRVDNVLNVATTSPGAARQGTLQGKRAINIA